MADMAFGGSDFRRGESAGKKKRGGRKKTTLGQRRERGMREEQSEWSGAKDRNDREVMFMLQRAMEEAQHEEELLRAAMGGRALSDDEWAGQSLNMEAEWRRRVLEEELGGLYEAAMGEQLGADDKAKRNRSKKWRREQAQRDMDSDAERATRDDPLAYEEVDFSDSEAERRAVRDMDDQDKIR